MLKMFRKNGHSPYHIFFLHGQNLVHHLCPDMRGFGVFDSFASIYLIWDKSHGAQKTERFNYIICYILRSLG